MEKSFTSKELKTVIQGALQQILEARGVENFEDLEEGSGDRNDPDRVQGRGPGRQRAGSAGNPGTHGALEETEEEEETLEEEEEIEEYKRTNVNGREPGRSRLDPNTHEKLREDEEEIFAPNHYCVHHGGVNHNGKIEMAEAVNHNYNEELARVTHYDMKLEDGTVLENVAFEDIQVTNASLAKEHMHANRDDSPKKKKKKKPFPDLTGDGKVTQADVLQARGVKLEEDEVEDRPLKEWYEGSIYGKLLKEWTKEN